MVQKLFSVVLACIVLLCIGIFSPTIVYAVSVSVVNPPSSITQDPFTLTASISGATNGTNYLRVDIYKDATQNYFGETFNGSDWYGLSDYHLFLPVTIANNSWAGTLQGRIASPTTSQYDGAGTYRIRIRRYTSSGGYTASEADASSFIVSIVIPTPTPSPTPTPFPTSVPTATPTPLPATNTPTPKPSFTPTPTLVLLVTLASQPGSIATQSARVLGSSVSTEPTLVAGVDTKERNVNWVSILFLAGGIIVCACGILYYYYKRGKADGHTRDE